jgi:glycosyltransferase involved in cell wall biosynthesis
MLFLGRLHVKKGVEMLIDAFRAVRPPMRLVVAGPPDTAAYGERLRRRAEGLPVDFVGMLRGEEKWGALAAAEVFALPSHQENFGVAVAEALAAGTPVLVSERVNIWREIVEAGAGWAEPDDAAGTRRLVERWVAEGNAGMRERAAACFAARFDIASTARRFAALLAEDGAG